MCAFHRYWICYNTDFLYLQFIVVTMHKEYIWVTYSDVDRFDQHNYYFITHSIITSRFQIYLCFFFTTTLFILKCIIVQTLIFTHFICILHFISTFLVVVYNLHPSTYMERKAFWESKFKSHNTYNFFLCLHKYGEAHLYLNQLGYKTSCLLL